MATFCNGSFVAVVAVGNGFFVSAAMDDAISASAVALRVASVVVS